MLHLAGKTFFDAPVGGAVLKMGMVVPYSWFFLMTGKFVQFSKCLKLDGKRATVLSYVTWPMCASVTSKLTHSKW